MVELVSSLGGNYIAPGLSFASFAVSVAITPLQRSAPLQVTFILHHGTWEGTQLHP